MNHSYSKSTRIASRIIHTHSIRAVNLFVSGIVFMFLYTSFTNPTSAAESFEIKPGKATHFRWEPVKSNIAVFLPTDYDAKKTWPLFVFFHGTGGSPNVGPIREASHEKGWVILAMTYITKGHMRNGKTQMVDEWKNTKTAIDYIATHINIDKQRIYIGGFSKGGWMTGMIAEAYPDEIAGAWIGGAGVTPRFANMPKPNGTYIARRGKKPTPIYIGVGELDINRIAALDGITHYAKLNGQVTFDEYANIGHAYKNTSSIEDWFAVELLRDQPPEDFTKRVDAKVDEMTKAARALPDKWMTYRTLDELKYNPWYQATSRKKQIAIAKSLIAYRRDATVIRQLKAKLQYERLNRMEIHRRNLAVPARTMAQARQMAIDHAKNMVKLYGKLQTEHPNTDYAEKSKADQKRVVSHIKLMAAMVPK